MIPLFDVLCVQRNSNVILYIQMINIQYNIRLLTRNDIGGCLAFQIRGVELLRRFDQKTDSADEDVYYFSEDDNLLARMCQ